MIRQDYLIRLLQQLVDALFRVLALKNRMEYSQALAEVDAVLARLRKGDKDQDDPPDLFALPDLIRLCEEAGDNTSEQLMVLANLYSVRGELLERENRPAEAPENFALALGLTLEAMLRGPTSLEQVQNVEHLIPLADLSLSGPVYQRLLDYCHARGMFARGEDFLYAWLDSGDAEAISAGRAFYERLALMPDDALRQGGLPREEVLEGLADLANRK